MNIDIKLLRIFVAVVDCGGFAAAERELNLARSTISNHMAELESRLGMTLCRRGRAGFALTPTGQSIYSAALKLLSSAQAFHSHVDSLNHSLLTGELKLAITDGTLNDSNLKLTETLRKFEEKAPKVFLRLSCASQEDIERQLVKGEIDLGVIAHHRSLPDFNYYRLYQEPSYLYCAQQHPLFTSKDSEIDHSVLQQQKFVHADFQLNSEVQKLTQQFNACASAGHVEARTQLILAGSHIGFLPEHFAAPLLKQEKLRKLKPSNKYYYSDISAVTSKDKQRDPLLSLFLATLKDLYHDHTTQN